MAAFKLECGIWAAAGLSGLLRGLKRAGPRPAGAPRVALPVRGPLPFQPLRGSLVNPCRDAWRFEMRILMLVVSEGFGVGAAHVPALSWRLKGWVRFVAE